jgi:hypothetical protein
VLYKACELYTVCGLFTACELCTACGYIQRVSYIQREGYIQRVNYKQRVSYIQLESYILFAKNDYGGARCKVMSQNYCSGDVTSFRTTYFVYVNVRRGIYVQSAVRVCCPPLDMNLKEKRTRGRRNADCSISVLACS